MAFLAPALPFLAAAGSVVQGIGGFMAGQANKKRAFAQAKEEVRASNEQETEIRKDFRRKIGAQLAAQFGNGMEGGSGTALAALRESQLEAALDVMTTRRMGASRAAALRSQGKAEERQGYFSLASGLLGAGSSVHSQQVDWAQARSGTTPRAGV